MKLNKLNIAVVGASNNPKKFGHIVFQDLLKKNCRVVPVNPIQDSVLGHAVCHNLKDCTTKIDLVVFVTPPRITEKVLEDVRELGIAEVWMQPGSESRKAIEFCENHGIHYIHDRCIMEKGAMT